MKIVCIGDSFIGGFGVNHEKCWVSRLEKLTGFEVVNKGINGDTSLGVLARFNRDVVDEKPRYAIINCGWNDFLTGVDTSVAKDVIMSVVHQAYANSIIPIIISMPAGNSSLFRQNWPRFIDIDKLTENYTEYVSYLREFCRGFSVFFIDCFSFADNEEFKNNHYIDGIHMDEKGHELISEFVLSSLKEII